MLNILLAQMAGWDIKTLAQNLIIIIGCVCLIGAVLTVPKIKELVAWVPQFVWTVLIIVAVVLFALWGLHQL